MPEEPAGNLEPIPMSAIMIGAPNGEAPTEPTPGTNGHSPVDPPGNAPGSLGRNADHEGSSATPSLKEKFSDLFSMFLSLGRGGHIWRSLLRTQRADGGIDRQKWNTFCINFNREVDNTNLLATVLVASNFSFLAIQSVDAITRFNGAKTFSCVSLICGLLSITVGMTLRTPRPVVIVSPPPARWTRCRNSIVVGLFILPAFLCQYSGIWLLAAVVSHTAGILGYHLLAFFLLCVVLFMPTYWWLTFPSDE